MDSGSKAAVDEGTDSQEQTSCPRDVELRRVRRILAALLILASLVAAWAASSILIPLAAALLINLLFKPMVRRLEWMGIPPTVTATLLMIGLLLAVFTAGSTLWGSLAAWIDTAPQAVEQLEEKLSSLRGPMRQVTQATERVENIAENNGTPVREPVEVKVKESAFPTTAFHVTTSFIVGLTLTLVIAFFLLASGDLLLRQLVQSLPSLHDKKEAVQAFYDLETHVSSYLVTVALINSGLAVIVWGLLWLLGLPYAMWWGITAGVANFIPYLGPLVTTVLLFAASLLAFDTLGQALIPPVVLITVNSLEGYLVTPAVVGRRLSLNPLILILWLVFWGWLWGIAGALLAVPMLICFKIICDHMAALEPMSHLLSGYVRKAGET